MNSLDWFMVEEFLNDEDTFYSNDHWECFSRLFNSGRLNRDQILLLKEKGRHIFNYSDEETEEEDDMN